MDRNPYLMLGLPFGASREEANVAFARRARPLRKAQNRERLMELTWALNQIDEAIANPDAALEIYRIPADPLAFESEGAGVFAPGPERFDRCELDSEAALSDLLFRVSHELLVGTLYALGRARQLPSY